MYLVSGEAIRSSSSKEVNSFMLNPTELPVLHVSGILKKRERLFGGAIRVNHNSTALINQFSRILAICGTRHPFESAKV